MEEAIRNLYVEASSRCNLRRIRKRRTLKGFSSF